MVGCTERNASVVAKGLIIKNWTLEHGIGNIFQNIREKGFLGVILKTNVKNYTYFEKTITVTDVLSFSTFYKLRCNMLLL